MLNSSIRRKSFSKWALFKSHFFLFKHISHKMFFMTYASREIVWKTFSFYTIEINIKILVLAFMFSENEKLYPIIMGKYSYLCICNHYVIMITTWTKRCFVACYWFWIFFIYLSHPFIMNIITLRRIAILGRYNNK